MSDSNDSEDESEIEINKLQKFYKKHRPEYDVNKVKELYRKHGIDIWEQLIRKYKLEAVNEANPTYVKKWILQKKQEKIQRLLQAIEDQDYHKADSIFKDERISPSDRVDISKYASRLTWSSYSESVLHVALQLKDQILLRSVCEHEKFSIANDDMEYLFMISMYNQPENLSFVLQHEKVDKECVFNFWSKIIGGEFDTFATDFGQDCGDIERAVAVILPVLDPKLHYSSENTTVLASVESIPEGGHVGSLTKESLLAEYFKVHGGKRVIDAVAAGGTKGKKIKKKK